MNALLLTKRLEELVVGDVVYAASAFADSVTKSPFTCGDVVVTDTTIEHMLGMRHIMAKTLSSAMFIVLVEYPPQPYFWVRGSTSTSDPSRYPHKCPRCGARAYVGCGPADVDCSKKCNRVTTALRAS